MDKEEIRAKLVELGNQVAEISNEIIKLENGPVVRISITVTNVGGVAQVGIQAETANMDGVIKDLKNVLEHLIQENDKPAMDKVNVEDELKDILDKRKPGLN